MTFPPLNPHEIRVLGSLIEKELSTPDYYPLTLNALTSACNQRSNREPVMTLDDTDVVRALDGLRLRGLAMQAHGEGSRVPKYRHALTEKLYLERDELAILCELLLRGPQTVGELRGRACRLHTFDDLPEVEQVLEQLAERTPSLTMKLPRRPGHKECRYAQLFAGAPDLAAEDSPPQPEVARLQVLAENERLTRLEEELSTLREELAALRDEFRRFRTQFD